MNHEGILLLSQVKTYAITLTDIQHLKRAREREQPKVQVKKSLLMDYGKILRTNQHTKISKSKRGGSNIAKCSERKRKKST